jgi:hypothetical protein
VLCFPSYVGERGALVFSGYVHVCGHEHVHIRLVPCLPTSSVNEPFSDTWALAVYGYVQKKTLGASFRDIKGLSIGDLRISVTKLLGLERVYVEQ